MRCISEGLLKKQNEFSKATGNNEMENVEGKQHRPQWRSL